MADETSPVTESFLSKETVVVVAGSRSVDLEQPEGVTHKKKKCLSLDLKLKMVTSMPIE